MANTNWTGLTVEGRKTSDGESYEFGVRVEGVFVPVLTRKAGGLDDAIALELESQKARDAQAATERAAADEAARQQAVADASAQAQQPADQQQQQPQQ